jgi:serine/threonine protein kinase
MKGSKCEHIVHMYDVFIYRQHVAFVIEFCEGGDLRKFLQKNGRILEEKIAVDILQ